MRGQWLNDYGKQQMSTPARSERDVRDMTKIDECDMEKCTTLENNENAIAMLGDRCWPQKTKQGGDKESKKKCYVIYGEKSNERPNVGRSLSKE